MSAPRLRAVSGVGHHGHMDKMHATSDDGTTITAVGEGIGPALLIVHPGGQDERSWNVVASSLAEEFQVVRIRRRIYAADGAAAWDGHTVEVEAADVLAVAALLKKPVYLIGHSSGAVAALEAALRDPSAFSGVLVYEPPMPTRELVGGEAYVRARAALDAGDAVETMRIHLRDIVQMPAQVVEGIIRASGSDPNSQVDFVRLMAAQLADTHALDGLGLGVDRYRALDLPVVLLVGDSSPAHLLERTEDLAAVLPDARVVTLQGQGHIAHLMAPKMLSDEIRAAAVGQ